MISTSQRLNEGTRVKSTAHGFGSVIVDQGPTVVVRFGHGIEECDKSSLSRELGPIEAFDRADLDVPLEVINRLQAEVIRSVNDAWGVFSRSRIELLPHQLWVCRKVNGEWPTRWLVADDDGLGKTIEAGSPDAKTYRTINADLNKKMMNTFSVQTKSDPNSN